MLWGALFVPLQSGDGCGLSTDARPTFVEFICFLGYPTPVEDAVHVILRQLDMDLALRGIPSFTFSVGHQHAGVRNFYMGTPGSFGSSWEEFGEDRYTVPAHRPPNNQGTAETSTQAPSAQKSDIISAIILSDGKMPHIEKAYRVVPHGMQAGLGTTNLRSMVKVDANKGSLYKHAIEQRAAHESDKPLHYWLKIFANSGSYGLFVELNPSENSKKAEIKVFAGEETFPETRPVIEKAGDWYAPPIASLITSGGRLLLAMLETAVRKAGGSYLFSDTDSLCVVSSKHGGPLKILGANGERVLR